MTYEYKCPNCEDDVIHEVSKPIAQFDREERCPNCKELMERQVSRPSGFQFKGTGFYQTDYKNKGK